MAIVISWKTDQVTPAYLHAYLLAEMFNVFDGNLGVFTNAVPHTDPQQIILSDAQASIFWISLCPVLFRLTFQSQPKQRVHKQRCRWWHIWILVFLASSANWAFCLQICEQQHVSKCYWEIHQSWTGCILDSCHLAHLMETQLTPQILGFKSTTWCNLTVWYFCFSNNRISETTPLGSYNPRQGPYNGFPVDELPWQLKPVVGTYLNQLE
jgi:hypothetical protein